MWTYNNKIFRNCFAIIHCDPTKVSAPINKCIIFETNELSITLSTQWKYLRFYTVPLQLFDLYRWLLNRLVHTYESKPKLPLRRIPICVQSSRLVHTTSPHQCTCSTRASRHAPLEHIFPHPDLLVELEISLILQNTTRWIPKYGILL